MFGYVTHNQDIRMIIIEESSFVDVDECNTALNECEQVCSNTIGLYVCDCAVGYILDENGKTCNGRITIRSNFILIIQIMVKI